MIIWLAFRTFRTICIELWLKYQGSKSKAESQSSSRSSSRQVGAQAYCSDSEYYSLFVCLSFYSNYSISLNSLPFVEFLPWHESGTLISHFRHRFWNQRPGAFFPLFSSANYNWQQLVKHLTNVWFLRRTRIPTSENQQQVRARDPPGCANQR